MKYIVCFIVGIALVLGGGLAMAADKKAADPFTAMDADKDGKVSLKEFQAGKKDAGAAEKEFKAMDKNGDGSLSKDELGAAKKAAEPKKK